jgi:hypothetical protein
LISTSEERLVLADGELLSAVVERLCCQTSAHCRPAVPAPEAAHQRRTIIVHHVFAYRLITPVAGEATMEFAVENKLGTVGHLRMQRDMTRFRLRDLAFLG